MMSASSLGVFVFLIIANDLHSLPDYKPVSVPLRAAAIPLGRPLLGGSSNLPES